MKILSFGEVLFDVYEDASFIGGAPLNLAAHISLQGGDAYLLSCVGKDDLGEKALKETKKLGVKTDYIGKTELYETGKCNVTLDQNKLPSYNLLQNVAYDYIPCPDFKENFDILAFGTLSLRQDSNIETLKKIISENNFTEIYSDLNIRPPFYSDKSILFCLENATIVKISDEELPSVLKAVTDKEYDVYESAELLCEKFKNLKLVIITLGENGSFLLSAKDKKIYKCPAVKTKVVSTVGAGDSFGATFLNSYFKDNDIDLALKLASKISAFVVSQKDAVPYYEKELLK